MSGQNPLDFTLAETDRGGERTVTVGGDLDVVAAAQLAETLRRTLADGRPLLLDLTEVVFMDSSGLAAILKTPSVDQRAQITLAPSRHAQPKRLLEMTGACDVFTRR